MSRAIPNPSAAAGDTGETDPSPARPPAAGPLTTLAYEPPGSGGRVTARQVRWGIVVLGAWLVGMVLLYNPLFQLSESLGLGLWGTPAAPLDLNQSDASLKVQYVLSIAAYLGALLLAQALFLLPRGPLAFRLVDRGRPMRRALLVAVAAGMVAMLVTVGLVATLLDVPGWWVGVTVSDSGNTPPPRGLRPLHWLWVGMLLVWALWAVVFFRYARDRDHRTAAARITRALLAGTVLELLVSGPAHAWALRKQSQGLYDHDCYCARGSYTGLVFGCTALVWLFGPGVFLLVLREKRRREEIVTNGR